MDYFKQRANNIGAAYLKRQVAIMTILTTGFGIASGYCFEQGDDWDRSGWGWAIGAMITLIIAIVDSEKKNKAIEDSEQLSKELQEAVSGLRELLMADLRTVASKLGGFTNADRISVHRWKRDNKYEMLQRYSLNPLYDQRRDLIIENIGNMKTAFNAADGKRFKGAANAQGLCGDGFGPQHLSNTTMKSCVMYCRTIPVNGTNLAMLTIESTTQNRWMTITQLDAATDEMIEKIGLYVAKVKPAKPIPADEPFR